MQWVFVRMSLDRSLDRSLPRTIARSLDRSIARSFARSLDRSLHRSLAIGSAQNLFVTDEYVPWLSHHVLWECNMLRGDAGQVHVYNSLRLLSTSTHDLVKTTQQRA